MDEGRHSGARQALFCHRSRLARIGRFGKPSEGYDKRTLASDVHEVVKGLGIAKILLVGHDFGAAVAYAYAAERRSEVTKLVIYEMLMPGFGYEDALGSHPFAKDGQGRQIWHLAFHDAPHAMQEFLIHGRERKYLDFYWDTFAYNPRSVSKSERREYARGYEGPGGLNALKYYQNHWLDAEHNREFAKKPLAMPVLASAGRRSPAIWSRKACVRSPPMSEAGYSRLRPLADGREAGLHRQATPRFLQRVGCSRRGAKAKQGFGLSAAPRFV